MARQRAQVLPPALLIFGRFGGGECLGCTYADSATGNSRATAHSDTGEFGPTLAGTSKPRRSSVPSTRSGLGA